MIKELSQAGGSEVPKIKARGAFISAGDVVEGSSKPKEYHERPYPSSQPGEIQ